MAPAIPPIALARPPPSTADVNQGNQALTATINAHSATSQPGRTRAISKEYCVRRACLTTTLDTRVILMSDRPELACQLDLSPHPEGGWYRETWRSDLTIPGAALPPDYAGPRNAGTAILFLLMPGQQSAWHTVRSAELWLYHSGSPLFLDFGEDQSSAQSHLLGADVMAGESPQLLVPAGHWQRARPRDDHPCLVSCVVVPGFDFADFAMGAPGD